MIDSILGLSVARGIPAEVVSGLITGMYRLDGGVIRWAANTENAGQIIRHLIPIASSISPTSLLTPISGVMGAVNTYQLHGLSNKINTLTETTQQVLQIANTSMVLSGLNLAVTAVGFYVLNEKLKNLEGKLNEIQNEVKSIRTLLELDERARLGSALRDLLNITHVKNPDHRHTLLFNSKNILAPISLKYKELLTTADSIELAMAYEEYFCLTSLAHARCLAELGMLDMAYRDITETNQFWREQAQRIGSELLIGEYPERFIYKEFSDDLPISVLVEWFDVIYNEPKGYRWIDELRGKTIPWYEKDDYSNLGIFDVISSFSPSSSKKTRLENQRNKVIPSIQKLVARNKVLTGFCEQYKLLETSNITPSDFDAKIKELSDKHSTNGYVILEP
jgi:hypothetical protein